jgi:hypothetical protein
MKRTALLIGLFSYTALFSQMPARKIDMDNVRQGENVEYCVTHKKMNELKRKLLEYEEELVTVYLIRGKISQDPDRVDVYKLIPEMIGKKSFEGSLMRQIEELNN